MTSEPKNVHGTERAASIAGGIGLLLVSRMMPRWMRFVAKTIGWGLATRGVSGRCAMKRTLGPRVENFLATRRSKANGRVDFESDQSFPASDAPSWSPVTGMAR